MVDSVERNLAMGYQVTIHTAEEVARYRREVEESGVDVGDAASYSPAADKVGPFGGAYRTEAELSCWFRRPRTNLATKKEWIEMLVRAVEHCQRKGDGGRGVSKAELLELVRYSPAHPEMVEEAAAKGARQAKVNEMQWSAPGIRVLCGRSNEMRRGLDGSETLALLRRLGLEDEAKARCR